MNIRFVSNAAFLTLLLIFLSSKTHGLEPPDLQGAWQVKSETEMPEGLVLITDYTAIFYQDGSFFQTGTTFIMDENEATRLLTATGPDRGHWKIDEEILTMSYEKVGLEYFSGVLPGLDRKTFEMMLNDGLDKPDLLTLQKDEKEGMIFRDEEGTLYRFMRIDDSPFAGQTGEAFMKPAASFTIEELGGDPTKREGVEKDPRGKTIRANSRAILASDGFKAADGLPTFSQRKGLGGQLRPREEILSRLLAMQAVVNWVVVDAEDLASEEIEAFIERHRLKQFLTDKEKAILALKRAEARKQHADSIGWSMESMWALAWVLGFDHAPDIDQGQVSAELLSSLWDFLNPAWKGESDLDQHFQLRDAAEVIQAEDLFYCAHNAVRSAQLGSKESVPDGYHPIILGGIVHEKRHALTWVLSPDVAWEDTDLST